MLYNVSGIQQSDLILYMYICIYLYIFFFRFFFITGYYKVVQTVKNLPIILETQVQFQSWEDPLQKGVATHSIILAWRILWTEEPGWL